MCLTRKPIRIYDLLVKPEMANDLGEIVREKGLFVTLEVRNRESKDRHNSALAFEAAVTFDGTKSTIFASDEAISR